MGSLKLRKPYIYVYLPGFILLLAAILLHFVDVFVAVIESKDEFLTYKYAFIVTVDYRDFFAYL